MISGHLDRPVAQTLDFSSLNASPTSAQTAWLHKNLEEGRFGKGQRKAARRARTSPLEMAVFVGGAFGALLLLTTLVMLVQGDMESAGIGAVVTVVVFVVAGGIAYLGATVGARNRWRRHTTVALFAVANGLDFQLVPPADQLPRLVRTSGRRGKPEHADLVAGRVQGRELLTGYRTTFVSAGDTSDTWRFVWAALELDPDRALSTFDWKRFEARCKAIGGRADLEIHRDDAWLVVGVEDRRGSLGVIPDLMAMIDLALDTQDGPFS